MDEIAFRHNANQLPGRVHHRKCADVTLQHGFCRVHNRGLRSNGDDGPGHYLMSAHLGLRSLSICRRSVCLVGVADLTHVKESEHVSLLDPAQCSSIASIVFFFERAKAEVTMTERSEFGVATPTYLVAATETPFATARKNALN